MTQHSIILNVENITQKMDNEGDFEVRRSLSLSLSPILTSPVFLKLTPEANLSTWLQTILCVHEFGCMSRKNGQAVEYTDYHSQPASVLYASHTYTQLLHDAQDCSSY